MSCMVSSWLAGRLTMTIERGQEVAVLQVDRVSKARAAYGRCGQPASHIVTYLQ